MGARGSAVIACCCDSPALPPLGGKGGSKDSCSVPLVKSLLLGSPFWGRGGVPLLGGPLFGGGVPFLGEGSARISHEKAPSAPLGQHD